MKIDYIENSFDKDLKDIIICDENYKLKIMFSGNGDLYLNLYTQDRDKDYFKVNIKKDDCVYYYFKMLFNDLCKRLSDMSEYDKLNHYIMAKCFLEEISYEDYLKNSKIIFFSDSAPLKECNAICFSQNHEDIIIEFIKNELDTLRGFNVRISNSGSRHKPLNVSFMKMYNNLQNYNEQIRE